ncbi:MAG: Rrf2 family transcriptional regulator [Pirellulaceae bacterium]|nr:Rrf2 family transcriptional regulator [Pirellulaceae bacterium]
MRLALYTDYALRTLLYLAMHPGRGSVAKVAEFFHISKDHVAKVVQALAKLKYVRSVRGVGGGIELLQRPADIRVGQVILDFEGSMNLLECISVQNVCTIQPNCRLRSVLAQAEKLQMDYLKSVRLSELLPGGDKLLTIGTIEIEL